MITYLSVLLFLGLAGPGPATALQFDTYSVSGFIQPFSPSALSGAFASVTMTAQDFRLGIGFSSFNLEPLFEFVGIRCFAPGSEFPRATCRPGDRITASARASGTDVSAGIVLAGQGIPTCDVQRRPLFGHLCASAGFGSEGGPSVRWGSPVLPPFTGAPPGHSAPDVPADILNLTTVASTFSVDFSVTVWDSALFPPVLPVRVDGFGVTGTGPAQFVLEWQPATGTWTPLFAEGRFDVAPIPEPATLLLFGTTAAGLGLARWYRRRARGQQDAA